MATFVAKKKIKIYAYVFLGGLSMGGDPIPSSIRNTLKMGAHWVDTWLRNDCY